MRDLPEPAPSGAEIAAGRPGVFAELPIRASATARYVAAIALFLLALALRFALDGDLPPGFPFLTFFPAVVLASFALGTGPAVLCAALGGLSAWVFFLPPFGVLTLTGGQALALGLYVFVVGLDIALIHVMRRTAEKLARARALAAQLHGEQRLMFEELQHRVANNMSFVASLLGLGRSRVEAEPAAAAEVLAGAQERLLTLARVHRRLHDPAAAGRPVDEHLRAVCEEVVEASGVPGVRVRVEGEAVRLDLPRLITLSLLTIELVTNSLKHAFQGREAGGAIAVALRRAGPGRLELAVADDGVGLPGRVAPSGLGTRIAAGLAAQLGGELAVGPGPGGVGTDARVVFPAG